MARAVRTGFGASAAEAPRPGGGEARLPDVMRLPFGVRGAGLQCLKDDDGPYGLGRRGRYQPWRGAGPCRNGDLPTRPDVAGGDSGQDALTERDSSDSIICCVNNTDGLAEENA